MLNRAALAALASSLLVQSAFGFALTPLSTYVVDGLDKRSNDWSSLDLRDYDSLYWAASASPQTAYLANLTLFYPGENEYVISMDRFAGMLDAVECKDPNLMLDFKDSSSFEYAKKAWNWVNENEDHKFIMVADYSGCGPDGERQPFEVTDVKYDEMKFIAYLTAREKDWQEIAHSYHLRVGQVSMPTARLARRYTDLALSMESSLTANWFEQTVDGVEMTAGCTDCGTSGSLNFDFEVDVSWFSLNEASMTVSPQDVEAHIELGFSAEGNLTDSWGWEKELVSIPLQGITILNIVELGGFFTVDAGFEFGNWKGSAEVSAGAKMTIDNGALLKIDLLDSSQNTFSGWVPSFESIPPHVSAKVEAEASAYLKPAIELKAEAFSKGWEIALGLRCPYIEANLAAMFDTAGVCDTEQPFGVEAGLSVGIDLEVSAANADDAGNPFWKWTILDFSKPLVDLCFPFGSADGNATSSSAPTISATPSVPLGTGVSSAIPPIGTGSYIPPVGTGFSMAPVPIPSSFVWLSYSAGVSSFAVPSSWAPLPTSWAAGTGFSSYAAPVGTGASSVVPPIGTGASSYYPPIGTGVSSVVAPISSLAGTGFQSYSSFAPIPSSFPGTGFSSVVAPASSYAPVSSYVPDVSSVAVAVSSVVAPESSPAYTPSYSHFTTSFVPTGASSSLYPVYTSALNSTLVKMRREWEA